MDIEVDSQDVIKVVLQFLKENNLHKSMKALQEESNVSLNVVDNLDKLISDIHNGSLVLITSLHHFFAFYYICCI